MYDMLSESRGKYRHDLRKEIHEHPEAVIRALADKLSPRGELWFDSLGPGAMKLLSEVRQVQIVASGSSYHAGMVACYWLEAVAKVPCRVEEASEFRYRRGVVMPGTLCLLISQSGESAATLAALYAAKGEPYLATLAVCHTPGSRLASESERCMFTHASLEHGKPTNKGFTAQLAVLAWLALAIGRQRRVLDANSLAEGIEALHALPEQLYQVLELEPTIAELAPLLATKHKVLFIGEGSHYPIAREAAYKLKELAGIDAEAYDPSELENARQALMKGDIGVVTVAPSGMSSQLEVRARGSQLINFSCEHAKILDSERINNLSLPKFSKMTSPIIYFVAMKLLRYYMALVKGTDVEKPRDISGLAAAK
ncbi:SIS domain-containing protein [Halomonas sp. KM-1]|uniref:SIS domain-containing protein n=1 Tax=Halomonas sp. KM-1 TaxID=590061 RepID=UPI00028841AF|nr:SIS domain-containing protein [Halomonas sp. KM-1]